MGEFRPSKPGERRGGRQKGTPNKTQATMKEAIQSVYQALQDGSGEPHGHFLKWAQETPTEFYKLASKLLPMQVEASVKLGLAEDLEKAQRRAGLK